MQFCKTQVIKKNKKLKISYLVLICCSFNPFAMR